MKSPRESLGTEPAISEEEWHLRARAAHAYYTAVRNGGLKKRLSPKFCESAFVRLREGDEAIRPIASGVSAALKTARQQAIRIYRQRCT